MLALVYFILQHIPFLSNLGRRDRHSVDKKYEDFMTALHRVVIVHQAGVDGQPSQFHFEDKAKALKGESV